MQSRLAQCARAVARGDVARERELGLYTTTSGVERQQGGPTRGLSTGLVYAARSCVVQSCDGSGFDGVEQWRAGQKARGAALVPTVGRWRARVQIQVASTGEEAR